ncbi:hypothetical protein F5X68DRAFT_249155, partial [Plectosphaerella plurivora]
MNDRTPQQDVSIIPLLAKDQYRPLDNLRSQLFFLVPTRLDEDVLQTALETLIRDHLPILGARIQPTGLGNALEYHLPRSFHADYCLFGWSSSTVNTPFSVVTLLAEQTQTDAAITWGTPTPELEKLWTLANWPTERKHEKPDCPLLLVHLTHYTDYTVVGTNLPHAVADQMGYASMIEAWLDLVQNKTPTPFLTMEQNLSMFETSSKFSDEELRTKGQYRLKSLFERIRVIISHAVEVSWEQEEERRMLFLSEESVSRLRGSYRESVRQKYGPESPSLSSSDVITGILTKLRYFNLQKPTFVSLSGTVNARGRHPDLPAGQPFLHNALGYSDARFHIGPDTTAAEIAYRNRLAVNEAIKLENIERCFAVHEGIFRGGYSPHIGEPGDTTFAVTNWTGAWRNIDFTVAADPRGPRNSAASAEAKSSEDGSRQSTIVLGISMERSVGVLRFSTQMMSRAAGGYWCDFSCSKKNMAAMDELLRRDPRLETI